MAIDMFFSQPVVASNSAAARRSGQIGPAGPDSSGGVQTVSASPEGDRDNFLSVLKQAARYKSPVRAPEPAAESQGAKQTVAGAGGKIDEASGQEISAVDIFRSTEPDEQPDPAAIAWNLTAFVKLLENLGFNQATDEASDLPTLAGAEPANTDLITAIESLIVGLQQPQFELPVDLKARLQQLQQFIAAALSTGDGVSGQGLGPGQTSDLVQINQWLTELTGPLQTQQSASDPLAGEEAAVAKAAPATAAEAESSGGMALKSPMINDGSPGRASLQSTEPSAVPSQSKNRSAEDPKLATDSQPGAAKNDDGPKAAAAVENAAAAAASKTKTAMAAGGWPQRGDHAAMPGRMAAASDQNQASLPEAESVKPKASSGSNPAAVKGSESQIQSAAAPESPAQALQEIQPAKDGGLKAASGAGEETVNKVIKVEAGAGDNGLLNSSGPNLQKAAEPAAVQKEIEAGQSQLRNQTLDQIVRKGAIHLRNGQHEARIDLKPDFLGHIRMQVISANHQVTVKILAEHGFVKDMIEGNLHQLKADLQQQGLAVDKLEVTVSRDADDSGNDKNKFAQSRARPGTADQQREEHSAEHKKRKFDRRAPTSAGMMTVDYFA